VRPHSSPAALPALLLAVLGAGVVATGGCVVSPPNVNVPTSDGGAHANVYADLVISESTQATTMSCLGSGGIPVCTTPAMPQGGPCAGNPALGMPDGQSFDVQPLGSLELGFLCSLIISQTLAPDGTLMPDFIVYGTADQGASPAVEVSLDGTTYVSVNPWASANGQARFELQAAMLTQARFVRISETAGGGQIHIDALEAVEGLLQ
jgi:hypothetical protein